MHKGTFSITGSISLAVVLAFTLGACQSDEPSDPDRANVDAMSREHANDNTAPSAAVDEAPARSVISQTLPYSETASDLVYGYFAAPDDMFEPLPAVIMIHEWWGLNDNIRAMADRLAGEGYIVLAVDLYGGEVANSPEEARQLMLQVVEDPDAANNNIRAAYKFVTEVVGAPRVGSLGWCFGGGWSLNTAKLFPDDLDASVIYYGQVTDDLEVLRPIATPILGLFAAEDNGIKRESVESFEAALTHLYKAHEIHIYPEVGHAFANPTGVNYNAAAAEDAWRRTLEFLGRYLSSDESADQPTG
jgi:carboxymethylenebutenolidase